MSIADEVAIKPLTWAGFKQVKQWLVRAVGADAVAVAIPTIGRSVEVFQRQSLRTEIAAGEGADNVAKFGAVLTATVAELQESSLLEDLYGSTVDIFGHAVKQSDELLAILAMDMTPLSTLDEMAAADVQELRDRLIVESKLTELLDREKNSLTAAVQAIVATVTPAAEVDETEATLDPAAE